MTHKFGKRKGTESLSLCLHVFPWQCATPAFPTKPPRAHGFVCSIWAWGATRTWFLWTASCLPRTGKDWPLLCLSAEAFSRWWISLRLHKSLYLRRAPLVSLRLPLRRMPVRLVPSAPTVFQELCSWASHRAAMCLGASFLTTLLMLISFLGSL